MGDGGSMSRLDRFMLSDGLIDSRSVVGQEVSDRDISDRFHIWLKANVLNWGLNSFKINNCQFDHPSIKEFMENEQKSLVAGSQAFVIKEKLKRLKDILRWLNREFFGWIDLEIEKYVVELNEDDVLLGNSNVVDIDEDQEGSGQDCLNVSNYFYFWQVVFGWCSGGK